MRIQPAQISHARELAYLINLAGEGIPDYLWQSMAENGETPLEVGTSRAAREEGSFSYRNAKVCIDDEQIQGMMVSYQQPTPYNIEDLADYPAIIQPLVRLESLAPGSWYINAIATFEQHRGKGVARQLIQEAENSARAAGCNLVSLIVASENSPALQLYLKLGYQVMSSLPVTPYPGCLHGGEWELMTKQL